MERVEKLLSGAFKSLCCAALVWSLLLVFPNAFAQGNSIKNDQFQESLLSGKDFFGERYKHHGNQIFFPNISLKRFLVSYNSEDQEEQDAIYAFLLGVTDTTEGKKWCSPDGYKSAKVLDVLNEGLKKLKSSRHNERAAYIITEILEKKYPCKKIAALPNSFAQNDSSQNTNNESFQKSILAEERSVGEQIVKQGKDIFVPNLSLKRFWVSYRSKNLQEQGAAYAFLLGVSDATEGKTWCGYYKFKSITIREIVYSSLIEIDSSRYDERAAYIIAGILENRHSLRKGALSCQTLPH